MSTMPESAAPGVHRLGRVVGLDEARAAGPVAVLARRARERNRATAGFLRAVHDAGRAVAGAERLPGPDEFSRDEVAARLGWSSSMAGRWVEFAADLVGRLPAVLAAMDAGDLDEVKARALSDWTRDLAADHARAVADEVLPTAPRLAVAELIGWVQELAVALDPEWAARREARARTRSRVVGSMNPSGTASLSGYDLPADEAVEALARVESIAAAVRGGGVRLPIGRLRALVYLRLLDGFGAGLDDPALVHALIRVLRTDDPDTGPDNHSPDDHGPDDHGPDDHGPDDHGPDNHSPDDDGPDDHGDDGPDDDGPDDHGPDDHGPDDHGPDGGGAAPGPDRSQDEAAADPEPERPADGADPPQDPDPPQNLGACEDGAAPEVEDPAPPTRGLRRGTVEVRLRLSTALGLDDLPARVPTWGPVLAGTARDLLAAKANAEWRVVVTDDQGRLRHVLLTRHRPAQHRPCRNRPPGPRSWRGARTGAGVSARGIVELQVPATHLAALDPAAHPGWAGLITDAQQRLAAGPVDGCPDHTPAARDGAGRRRARAELDRWVRVRDRHCAAVSCRRPALGCDLDHTRDWALNGPSAAWNLGALCRHHHRMKHLGRWRLRQPAPGEFVWRSRAGQVHLVLARRILDPLPAPTPRADGQRRPLPPDPGTPPPSNGLRPVPTEPTGSAARANTPRTTDPDSTAVVAPTLHHDRYDGADDDPPPF